jgi:SAM-dependent methyltransferase
MDNKSKEIVNNHYSNLINKYGFNNSGMGWRKGGLDKRYKIFTRHINFKNKNILDFGCGIGSFYKFLKENKVPIKKYYALEINPLLKNFIREKFKNKIYLIDNNFKNKKFDITISNGVHNFKIKKILTIFYKDLNFLIKVTKYAIGISFINKNVDYKENYLSYKSLDRIIKFIQKKKLKFIIDQTLNKYETFLFIIK